MIGAQQAKPWTHHTYHTPHHHIPPPAPTWRAESPTHPIPTPQHPCRANQVSYLPTRSPPYPSPPSQGELSQTKRVLRRAEEDAATLRAENAALSAEIRDLKHLHGLRLAFDATPEPTPGARRAGQLPGPLGDASDSGKLNSGAFDSGRAYAGAEGVTPGATPSLLARFDAAMPDSAVAGPGSSETPKRAQGPTPGQVRAVRGASLRVLDTWRDGVIDTLTLTCDAGRVGSTGDGDSPRRCAVGAWDAVRDAEGREPGAAALRGDERSRHAHWLGFFTTWALDPGSDPGLRFGHGRAHVVRRVVRGAPGHAPHGQEAQGGGDRGRPGSVAAAITLLRPGDCAACLGTVFGRLLVKFHAARARRVQRESISLF